MLYTQGDMVNSLISNRICFEAKGLQRDFILLAKTSLKLKNSSLCQILCISTRTLSDWSREKFHMSYSSAIMLAELSGVQIPKKHKIVNLNDHLKRISSAGGRANILKNGRRFIDEKKRMDGWQNWWDTSGKYNKSIVRIQASIEISVPEKNDLVAEFVGILLGDGCITKYFVKVTIGSSEVGYAQYVINLIYVLFKVKVKKIKKVNAEAVDIIIYRKKVVDYCLDLGLLIGNKVKQQVDIPDWIKNNVHYSKACLRGLFDTDGCFFYNSYWSGTKKYRYLKIAFTNYSLPIIKSVNLILKNLEINTSVSVAFRELRINDQASVKKYVSIIGTNNEKHRLRCSK